MVLRQVTSMKGCTQFSYHSMDFELAVLCYYQEPMPGYLHVASVIARYRIAALLHDA